MGGAVSEGMGNEIFLYVVQINHKDSSSTECMTGLVTNAGH